MKINIETIASFLTMVLSGVFLVINYTNVNTMVYLLVLIICIISFGKLIYEVGREDEKERMGIK